ncbi:MAG: endonuclease/exonuclease/phosphatase family protein [Candidatus Latescibacteria bacterium]|nr:endonuclease/exonuclease/phosphatase family protein [Candidatus Latescibacterota bacterium]
MPLQISKFYSAIIYQILLWTYAALVVFIWYGARFTPDHAVLIRVAASILSDLVWIPFGIYIWFDSILWILGFVIKPDRPIEFVKKWILALTVVLFFFMFNYETAFAFLFIPLSLFIAKTLLCFPGNILQKKFYAIYLPIILILCITISHYRWQMLPVFTSNTGVNTIKIMSYNIYSQAGFDDRMRVIKTIKNESPDVVCFIEFNPMRDPVLIQRELGDIFPYQMTGGHFSRWTQSVAFIMSRYPLAKIRVSNSSKVEDGHINFIFAEMTLDDRKINVVNYHLSTVGHHIENTVRKTFNLKEVGDTAIDYELPVDMEKNEQARFILETIATFKEPTILCGDLNDTPNSRAYHLLQSQFINTFSSKGWGLGSTFGESWIKNKKRLSRIPLLSLLARDVMRIDHIFVSRDITVLHSKVIRNAEGSDHKPVVAVVRLVKE